LGRVDEAQEELWRRYFKRLLGLARLKLGQTPRTVADEEDVATAALNSFFKGVAQGRFPRLRDRDELWPLLAKITSRKAIDQQRHLLAEKRGGGRIIRDLAAGGRRSLSGEWSDDLVDQEISPEFLVEMSEECDRLLRLLPDDELISIARLRLEGSTNAQIARELRVIERTVERRLQLIRSIWSEELRNNAGS
jgi:DNA-directed RNA polymerase specialized sigma24 family protein